MEGCRKFLTARSLLALIASLLSFTSVSAQTDTWPTLHIDSIEGYFSLRPYMKFWVDNAGSSSQVEVEARKDEFQLMEAIPENLDASAVYWVAFQVNSRVEKASDWMLQLGVVNFADVYISSDTGYVVKKAGVYCPHSEKDFHLAETEKVQLHLVPGDQKTIWIRVQQIDHSPPNLNFLLLELQYWKTLSKEVIHVIIALFQGMVLIIILYNLILFFTTRMWPHLYYALYLVSVSLFVLFALRVLQVLPTDHPKLITHVGFLSLALLSIFYFQFGRSFLNTRTLIPAWDRYLKMYIWIKIGILVVEQVILALTFHIEVVRDIEFAVIILDAVVSVFLIIRLIRTRSFLARFFIAGSALVMVFALVVTVLGNVFKIPDSFLFFLIAVVVEILIFSLGLGYRIKINEQEKLHAQEELTKQLLAADKLKDEFLANTSHELRTPLNGIIGIAESLHDGAAGKPSASMQQNLSMIVSSGRRLANLVNDLLDFSKLKSFDLKIQRKPVDMRALTDVVMQISKPLVQGKPLILKNEISADAPPVMGDENRLQQVMHNLIGNGIKFTPAGEVVVSAEEVGDMLEIIISDTGIGIPVDKMESIFQSFEQGDGSTAREYGGTGLGLSITKKLVELHGGTIQASSEEGKGSTFRFRIPISEEKAILPSIQKPVPTRVHALEAPIESENLTDYVEVSLENGGEKVRILVVDDEPINQQVVRNHLSRGNYEVRSAMNGEEALEAIAAEPPFDLVLLDIMMPQMSGFEVCQKIRESYLPSELPIIMVTAKNQVEDLVQGLSFGANDYLTKPFSKDEFLARIKTHLKLFNINAAYGRFVPREFLKALGQESIIDIKLGDQVEKEVTVFFSDIRAYTTLAETMTPQENFNFINAYLGRVGPIIKEHNGFVNQYYGDGVMALFLKKPEDAILASEEMHRVVDEYSAKRAKIGRLPIKIGIGLHTGSLMLGIIGDALRMEAGVVSDTVNTAARMEGLTKYYGSRLVVSEDTLSSLEAPSEFRYRFVGRVLVKGKKEPISIYDFFGGDPAPVIAVKTKTKEIFEAAMGHYFNGQIEEAAKAFMAVIAAFPEDQAADHYLQRCEALLEEGLPEGWTGVEEMRQK